MKSQTKVVKGDLVGPVVGGHYFVHHLMNSLAVMESLSFCPQNSGSLVCWTLTANLGPLVPAQWEHYWQVGCQERPVVAAVAVAAVAAAAAAAVAAVAGCFAPEEEEAEFELDRTLCVELTDF
jgi:hypothetical protein